MYNPLRPTDRHQAISLLLMILAALFALAALLMPAPARAHSLTPDLRPCLTKSEATTKSPSRHLYYRTNAAGQKCWTGGKVAAREAYATRGGKVETKAKANGLTDTPPGAGAGGGGARSGAPPLTYPDMENDAYLAICGRACPWLEPFDNRWRLK